MVLNVKLALCFPPFCCFFVARSEFCVMFYGVEKPHLFHCVFVGGALGVYFLGFLVVDFISVFVSDFANNVWHLHVLYIRFIFLFLHIITLYSTQD